MGNCQPKYVTSRRNLTSQKLQITDDDDDDDDDDNDDILSVFPLQNAVCFIILTHLIPVLFTFYIQGVLKLKIK